VTGSIDARGGVPRQRPHRVVPVLLESLAVQDGHTAAPVVGEYAAVVLGFSEPSGDVGEVGVATYRVRADPVPGWRPLVEGKRWDDTTYLVAPTWRTVLHGDGWTATWLAPRPVIGNLELRGTLTGDWTYGVSRLTRGRVLRARMVGGRIERTGPHSTGCVPGAAAVLRDVEVGTGFADGMTIDPAALPGPGVTARVLADPPVREHGVLLDFDLDDTPSPALRTPFFAGAVAAHGTDLWLVDRSLPTVLRLRGGVVVDWVSWPGMVLTGEGPRRALHADAYGCWITGPDGTVRADLAGRVHIVDETPVRHAAAAADGILALACDENRDHAATLWILRVGGDPVEVPIPGSVVVSLGAHADGFLVALTGRDSVYAHLTLDGHLTLGPPIEPTMHAGVRFFSGSLGLVRGSHRGRTIHRVGEDLTSLPVGEAPTGAYAGLVPGGWVQAGRMFVSGSLPQGRGERPWWPLDHQPDLPAGRTVNRYQLVSELDPDNLQPISSTLAPTGPLDLTVDDNGTVWVTAAGDLHRCPPCDGTMAEPVGLATLLDSASARVIGG